MAVTLLGSVEAFAQGGGYAYGNAPYSNPRPMAPTGQNLAQTVSPFHPVDFEQPVQPFAPADISYYGNGPPQRTGFFFSYEKLYWYMQAPKVAQIGSPDAVGYYTELPNNNPNNQEVLETNGMDTGWMNADAAWGNRYEIGYMENSDYGWLVGVIDHVKQTQRCHMNNVTMLFDDPRGFLGPDYQDNNGDGIDDDLDGDRIYGRHGIDTSVPPDGIPDTITVVLPGGTFIPIDEDDRQPYIPRFDELEIKNTTTLNGVELMQMYRAPRMKNGGTFELLYGVRYVHLQDQFAWFGIGGVLGDSFSVTNADNNILGPQIGFRAANSWGRWNCAIEARFLAGFNAQSMNQRSLIASNAGYAAASVTADATTEAMAQVAFLAFGIALGVAHFRDLDSAGPLTEAMVATLLLAIPGIAALILLQKKGADFAQRIAAKFFPQVRSGTTFREAIHDLYDAPGRLAASAALHLLAWIGAGGGTFIAFRLVGGQISLTDALALEALLCTLRSIAAFVPAALGVQEAGYAMLAPLFGLPAEMGLAVSLLKRAREIVIGIPALIYWQMVEGRAAMAAGKSTDG